MEKCGVTLGLYRHYEGETAWLYDVTDENGLKLLHMKKIDHFYLGYHSFSSERISEDTFTISHDEIYSTVEHKNREIERWMFLGRLVPQGRFYHII